LLFALCKGGVNGRDWATLTFGFSFLFFLQVPFQVLEEGIVHQEFFGVDFTPHSIDAHEQLVVGPKGFEPGVAIQLVNQTRFRLLRRHVHLRLLEAGVLELLLHLPSLGGVARGAFGIALIVPAYGELFGGEVDDRHLLLLLISVETQILDVLKSAHSSALFTSF